MLIFAIAMFLMIIFTLSLSIASIFNLYFYDKVFFGIAIFIMLLSLIITVINITHSSYLIK
ncbi:hypothetical protein [Caudoviricetes sp.]|nr:hypothetical protein [Caudoviricetes sp.]